MTADVGTGTTIVFATSGFAAGILDVNEDEISRAVIDKTVMASTGNRRKMPGDLVDWGDVTFEFEFDPDEQPPISAAPETITITFPVPSGGSTGATLAGEGFISAWQWGSPLEDKMTAQATITWTGDTGPTWTDST